MNTVFPITGYPKLRYDATREAFQRLISSTFGAQASVYPRPLLVIETFAGLGGQTRILAQAFPGAMHRGWEKDPECYQKLAQAHAEPGVGDRFSASEVDQGEFPLDYFHTLDWPHFHPTLLVVDGAYSLAQHEDYVPYHDPRAEFLIICEQARTRLHLHKKTYDLPEHMRGRELYEYYLRKVAQRHRRSLLGFEVTRYSPSYVLLGPVKP